MLVYNIMGKKMTFEKKVKKIVNKELQVELEEKVGVVGDRVGIFTAAIPSGNVGSSGNFISLLPPIEQGIGQYNRRVGNEIRLKRVDLTMLLNYKDSSGTGNYNDQSVGVRVMILKQKDNNDEAGFRSDAQTDKLLENGSIIAPGPSNFSGTTLNLVQKINREQFTVRYDKVHYIDRPREYNSSGGQLVFNKPPRPVIIKKSLTFGEKGLKLTFGNGVSVNPTNFPYVMVIGYASAMTTSAPSDNLLEYTYSANSKYTDA